MGTDAVGLLPYLRPWQRAGVEFLLADQPLPAPYSLCIAVQPAPRAAPPSPYRPSPRPVAAPVPAHPRPVQVPARPAASAPFMPAVSTAPAPTLLPPALWPEPWRQRLHKTAPAAVLWTYWALGEDFVRPNAERRALLQRLLGDLGHPAGTHSFWPAALPAALADAESAATGDPQARIDLQAHPEVFWSGVHALKARALVVMGSPALKALELPPRLRPFQQTRHKGRLVVILRDVDFLAQETHRYDAVKEFLKQALAPFGR